MYESFLTLHLFKGGLIVYANLLPADVLREIGMQPKYKGYAYVLFILQQTEAHPELMYNLSKGVYPMTMRRFCISRQNLERNIRFAIKRTWETGNKRAIRKIFGPYALQDRPSITEFITILTECMICKRTKVRRA